MKLLMPKATAVWLVDNTSLTFKQIADFCEMHELEIQAIADGEAFANITPINPIENHQLTKEEIARAEKDSDTQLKINTQRETIPEKKRAKYTPLSKRQNKPNAIAWIIKHHPEIPDSDVCKLIGTTKKTIEAIRNKTHRHSKNIQAGHPVNLGLCKQMELDELIGKYNKDDQ